MKTNETFEDRASITSIYISGVFAAVSKRKKRKTGRAKTAYHLPPE